MTSDPEEAARRAALELLLDRHSASPKSLAHPGPSDGEIEKMALAALRAPDHGKLVPFRFVVIRDGDLERLAELFVDYGRRHGKADDDLKAERRKAVQAPVVIAVVAAVDPSVPDVPVHEQWASVGGAISNAVMALHFMGYGAKMVSGARASDPDIVKAFCEPGETLVGWISCGTPVYPPRARDHVTPDRVLSRMGS